MSCSYSPDRMQSQDWQTSTVSGEGARGRGKRGICRTFNDKWADRLTTFILDPLTILSLLDLVNCRATCVYHGSLGRNRMADISCIWPMSKAWGAAPCSPCRMSTQKIDGEDKARYSRDRINTATTGGSNLREGFCSNGQLNQHSIFMQGSFDCFFWSGARRCPAVH